MASESVDNFSSREDAKKAKQLQEARAAGTAAPEIDSSTGAMINPHNPQFITSAPWYLNQSKPSLKHQQAWNMKEAGTKEWYKRGTKGDVKTKFMKGACENCGAMTHTKKDCVERPRQVGAKFNGKNLMPDEYVETLDLDYDGKRDRWNGFQADDYKEVIDEWEKVEAERRKVKAAQMEERAKLKERLKAQKKDLKKKRKQRRRQLRRMAEGRDTDTGDSDTGTGDSDMNDSDTDSDTDSDSDASDDEDLGEKMKDFDKTTATTGTKDDKLRTTTRNLRIREDTAKYLLNLDVNSAFYDPKSRAMRDDPLKHLKDEEKGAFRGDNFLRSSGDSKALTELTVFAWDSYKHGEKVHDLAMPTQALKMFQVYKQRAKDLKDTQQKELLDKYGGEQHLNAPTDRAHIRAERQLRRVLAGRPGAEGARAGPRQVEVRGGHVGGQPLVHLGVLVRFSIWQVGIRLLPPDDEERLLRAPAAARRGARGRGGARRGGAGAGRADAAAASASGGAAVASASGGGAAAAAAAEEAEDAGKASSSSDSDGSSSDEGGGAGQKEATAEKRKAKALAGLKLMAGGEQGGEAAAASAAAPDGAEAAAAYKLSEKKNSGFGHVLEDQVAALDQKAVAKAVEQEKKRRKTEKAKLSIDDERNRKYNSFGSDGQSTDVTAEDRNWRPTACPRCAETTPWRSSCEARESVRTRPRGELRARPTWTSAPSGLLQPPFSLLLQSS
ncbi:unnamed protein product [Prorocentrum cordatum]|uniref:Pre-mRNA-splicing factor SLU7 n=1 Tax=Prorocentrum cordatum TaxID=2364126 RepID=A0ABN9SYV0_9DINO|nr:unnamed protein product [Polarella glacialis]